MSLERLTTNAFEGTHRMSSLARRSLRTTAAAAGIAALGVGLAGHAFAAPEIAAPEIAAPEMSAPELAAPDGLESGPAMPDEDLGMPGILTVEMSRTAAAPMLPAGDAFVVPAAPAMPDAVAAPESPAELSDADGAVNNEDGTDRVNGPSMDDFGQGNVGALQDMDMAAVVMEMTQSAPIG